ncbi:enoyl-CoA hydratase/isomerase family protein [Blastococcus saxobsidens]|uniref:enoyl-CoA hydratase n=1 Tax=Blastococcus saxobsidens (strain DD2) TaxID=1146883 RepID=H6RSZ6_BLASD|nr:enoyl-CoA hydratase-related protein [Blastococcus saxobsidens]CCG04299.1 Enoyl-CoA hydratase [Blastococcus saxobsidens DD2]
MPESKDVEVSTRGRIGILTINRPSVRNNLGGDVVRGIYEALDAWRDDDAVGAVVLTGAGDKAFAAGADIGELQRRVPTDALVGRISGLLRTLEEYEKPTIAAVNGYALGGGCEVAMACDIRVAARNARFGQPEVNLGIIAGAGGTQRLARLVGKGRALDMLLTGRLVSAEEAERYGLATYVVDEGAALECAVEVAEGLLGKGPLALRLTKLAVHAGTDVDMDTGLLVERLAQAVAFASADKLEGTKAFLEKREASFTGR